MQAIKTQYFGPGNVRGSRYKATSASGLSVTVPIDHALTSSGNHALACRALLQKLRWLGIYIGAGLGDSQTVWVPLNSLERTNA